MEPRRSHFAAQESRTIAPIDCSTADSINAGESKPRSSRNGRLASHPSNIEPSQFSSRATVHRYSPPRRGKKVRSLPPDQASGHSGAAHHQSSGVQSDGAAATTHGEQSRDTGTHGSEGMTVSVHSCSMLGGGGTVRRAHACMYGSQPDTASIGAASIFARLQQKQGSHWGGAGGGAPCKSNCTRALRLPSGCNV